MASFERHTTGWRLLGGNLVLDLDKNTGSLARLTISDGKDFVWSAVPGQVTVRDDRLRKTFCREDLEHVDFLEKANTLTVKKSFRGAPWLLEETYSVEEDVIAWQAQVHLDSGDFRSCAIRYDLPWPQPLYNVSFWAAREGMPSAPHRFAEIGLEYGEVTSGILMPALSAYREDKDVGLLIAMPFDFRTPRFRFLSAYREMDLQAEFDRLALAPGKPARASLMFRGTPGAWRPALGWLYERFKEYFEPRSKTIHDLWGGHISGGCNVALEQAKAMVELGLRWHEVHCHFPAYGNYHPEGIEQWRSGHDRKDETLISADMIRRTIDNLHAAGSAAHPYIQVSGDGDSKLLDPIFEGSRVHDLHDNLIYSDYYDVYQMNSDLSLPFGKDITRQIDGMISRYPKIDGVFLDQACYNFLDIAHDDGITAVDNRPCYMTGYNYFPHLEHLSSLLHPHKSIIANGPYGIGIMKYIDAFMAEGSGWLCDQFQYYGLAKPMFFLVYDSTDRDIELMFQRCLIYAAGYSSYLAAAPSKDLYEKYVPLVERLYRRRWVFDPKPLQLPTGFQGNVFRMPSGSLTVSVVSTEPRLVGRSLKDCTVCVATSDIERVEKVTLQQPAGSVLEIPFAKGNGSVQFDVPGDTVAAVAELHLSP